MKAKEIRELTDKELRERIDAEREALNRLKINHSVSPLDNPLQIKVARNNVARMLTEVRVREINVANN